MGETTMEPLTELTITPEMLRLIAALDEFKGRWQAATELAPERLVAIKPRNGGDSLFSIESGYFVETGNSACQAAGEPYNISRPLLLQEIMVCAA